MSILNPKLSLVWAREEREGGRKERGGSVARREAGRRSDRFCTVLVVGESLCLSESLLSLVSRGVVLFY
jgi:hypothetical protein